jgi:hypothetical protein
MNDEQEHRAWGFMGHMKILLKSFVDDFLRLFDSAPDVDISLFCMSRYEPKYYSVDSELLELDDFNSLGEVVKSVRETSKIKNVFYSHPAADASLEIKKINMGHCEAIKMICEGKDCDSKYRFYIVGPLETDFFQIFLIFGIENRIIDQQFSLKSRRIEGVGLTSPTSFFESSLDAMFNYLQSQKLYDSSCWMPDRYVYEKLYKDGARSFCMRVGAYAKPIFEFNVFENIVKISSLAYEKKEGSAKIIFSPEGDIDVIVDVKFKNPVKMSDHRKVRKLMEVAKGNTSLISDGGNVFGFGRLVDGYSWNNEKIFILNVVRKSCWSLYSNSALVFTFDNFTIYPSKKDEYSSVAVDTVQRCFGLADGGKVQKIHEIINKVRQDDHGAILVFTEKAIAESDRLQKDGVCVEPFVVTGDTISLLTAVDGAIILNTDCICYAFGVVLDGDSTQIADSSRGSRYNSSLRYFESNKEQTKLLVVVKSDDGMINIMPELMPKISRHIISDIIAQLDGVVGGEEFDYRLYRSLINELDEKRFYLNDEDCELINSKIKIAEALIEKDSTITIHIKDSPFVGNSKLLEHDHFF